jgi:hypothetical protein
MSARNKLAALAAAWLLAAALPAASAQTVSAAPLAAADPWGAGWLGKADTLPNTFWSGSDADTIAPLLAGLKVESLSPAARGLLRRILLSSTRSPARGEADGVALIPERLRLLEQLGEGQRSVDLRGRFASTDWGKTSDRLASEMELVAGRSETACARVASRRADDADWMPVRALCYALAEDYDAAALVAEQVVNADGSANTWLLSAIETMREPTKTRPAGRYATPFDTAVSVSAKLSAPSNAFAAMPGDIALGVVRHVGATPEQKRAALPRAVDQGKANAADIVAVATLEAAKPAAPARGAKPKTDHFALALAAMKDDTLGAEGKADAYASALDAAETSLEFRTVAIAIAAPLKALAKTEATRPHAESFARAALSVGDEALAADWRKLMNTAPPETADVWAAARIDLMLDYAGAQVDSADTLKRLLSSVPPAPEAAAKAATPAERQAELRRIENTRVLFLYVGSGRILPSAARAMLASQKTAGRGVSDSVLARMEAALDAKANGEAALAGVPLVGSDASALSFAGLGDLIAHLRRAGLEKDADAIALEALQVWKAL